MSFPWADDGGQFPFNKYGQAPLPAIQGSQTPQPNEYNQIVPIGGRRSQISNITAIPAYAGDYAENRLRQVEDRLNMSEQSSRALLEEVVRLRGELKQSHNRTEEAIQGERQSRQTLAENIRASNDLIGQLGARLKRAEERVSDERTAVGALVNHTKQVEQAVLGSQQELVARRDQQLSKIAELRNDLDEANRLREQLERATTTLVDEVRTIKGKVETHHLESNSITHDVKERTKRLEEDNRTLIARYRLQNTDQEIITEKNLTQLRLQMSARLGEVRDVLMDLRNRVTTEETERRQQEQNFFLKLNDVQAQVHEQSRKRDETVHTIDVVQREREHAADNERLKMQGKIAEIAEEVSRKILSKEIRLREEAQQKFGNIEKYLHAEQAARIAHEQAMREENEKRWSALQKLTEEEVLHVREGQKLERHKNVGGMSKVNEYMDKLEKMQHETKKQLEAVMKAEIKSRQNQDKQIEDKIEDVQEKLGVAISTLQQAIGGINEQVSTATQQLKLKGNHGYQGKVQQMIEDQGQGGLRGLADLDARVMALQSKVATQEEGLQQTITKAISDAMDDKAAKALLDTQGEKIEQIDDWRDSADKKLKQIKERMDELGPEIREMNRTNESLQEDMKGIIDSESKDRIRDVQMVRQDLQVKYNQLVQDLEQVKRTGAVGAEPAAPVIPVSQKEKLAQGKGGGKVDEATKARIDDMEETINKQRKKFEELKEQIGKVESSIQTVRVHLGRKIDTETKARREETQDMQGLFEELQSRLAPLLNNNKAPAEDRKTPSNKDGGQGSGRGSKK
ncbi:golgin subfamily A member 6-like protein 22 isoform X2 [Asterias rubens]|uniref:golgin subfamily A member 6-like protein 22 isoform X2 n=1 Tax=Asterias rubens TaxID=7604 RepID=UPI00145542ED|nr:golgin subfamily A member 6-like protein 22 isoform X2 [Asterias rubens]